MFPNDEGANDLRNKKMKEVGEASNPAPPQPTNNLTNYFAHRGQPHVPPPGVPHVPLFRSLETSRLEHVLNTAEHTRPISYQYLMQVPDPEGYLHSFDNSDNRNTSQQNDQLIAELHGESLRNELSCMVEKIAEKAENKLKELDVELQRKSYEKSFLERKADYYRVQAEGLQTQVKSLQRTARSLRKAIKEANEELMRAEAAPEDAESYCVVPVKPVRLDCIACMRQVATVMMRPCRHLCVCKQCEQIMEDCPVCGALKVDSVEIFLPQN